MAFAVQARGQLLPLINRVLEVAAADVPDQRLYAFFTNVRAQAEAMEAEDDVLALFFELSTTAFLGFDYSAPVARAIDNLLGAAERIAFTMTAPEHHPH